MPRLFLSCWERDTEAGVGIYEVPDHAIEVTPQRSAKLHKALSTGDLSGLSADDRAKVEAMPDRARAMLAAHLEER
jgi:hypothetical protein